MTHSIIIYSKHCITEYNEGILLDQEGYRKGWQGIDHKVDEEGGKKSNSFRQRDLGTGYLGYNKDANCGHDGDKLGVCTERRGTAVGTGPYVGGGGRPRDGRVRKEVCVC